MNDWAALGQLPACVGHWGKGTSIIDVVTNPLLEETHLAVGHNCSINAHGSAHVNGTRFCEEEVWV